MDRRADLETGCECNYVASVIGDELRGSATDDAFQRAGAVAS